MNSQIKHIAEVIETCVNIGLVVFSIVTVIIIWKRPIKPWHK